MIRNAALTRSINSAIITQFAIAACLILNCLVANAAGSCALFPDHDQDPANKADSPARLVSRQKSVLQSCSSDSQTGDRVAIRTMDISKVSYFLLVDPFTLATSVEKKSCWKCHAVKLDALSDTRYGSAIVRINSIGEETDVKKILVDVGLKKSENVAKGSFVTADLCPSHKPLEREWIEDVAKIQANAPIALSVSGMWIKQHRDDFDWLKKGVAEEKYQITWVDHSYRHPFDPEKPIEETFLVGPGVDMTSEVLRNEKTLIEAGATPSVFFRFPGLISNPTLMKKLQALSLITVGTDAWIAHKENPHDASILLVHANGNEPGGPARFEKLQKKKQIPLPLRPLDSAVKERGY